MSDKVRSAINNAVKVAIAGVLLIATGGIADVIDWINGGEVPDLSTYAKAASVVVLAGVSALVSIGVDWLKEHDLLPGNPPAFPPPAPPAPEA